MKYILYFDFAAIAVCIMMIAIYFSYRTLRTWQNRIFEAMLLCALVSSVMDPVTVYSTFYLPASFIPLNYFLNIVYALFLNGFPMLFFAFNISEIKERYEVTQYEMYMLVLPYLIEAALIITTPMSHLVLYMQPDGSYCRGMGISVLFAGAVYYYAVIVIFVIRNRKKIKRIQLMSVLFFMGVTLAASFLQFRYDHVLIAQFSISLSTILMYMTLKNPLEYRDFDTKTFNRSAMIKTAGDLIGGQKRFSVIGVQVEGIKFVSDKYGTDNGNRLLMMAAGYLTELNRKCLVFHISAVTKFAIIVPEGCDPEVLISKIKERFQTAFCINNAEVSVWAYISEFSYPEDVKNITDLLDTIDYVTEEAVGSKNQRVVYGNELILNRRRREREIAQDMDVNVAHENFEICYQPIYNVSNGKYESMEALVRMPSRTYGMLMPAEFIPIAERNGQILRIGDIVLKKVCRFINENRLDEKAGISSVSVNLSGMQCIQTEMAEHLVRIIDENGIRHSMIDFEITESYASSDWDQLYGNMVQMGRYGINFALDDYGTGYSNTSKVMRYKYSVIKIDKTMLYDAESNIQAYILLKHTINMLKDMGMKVLIEGVETQQQSNLAKELGCELIQGFYYARPFSESDMLRFLQMNREI